MGLILFAGGSVVASFAGGSVVAAFAEGSAIVFCVAMNLCDGAMSSCGVALFGKGHKGSILSKKQHKGPRM